jgi:hypothetical protein
LYRILNGGREPFLSSSTFTPDEREAAQKRRMAGETLPPPVNGSPELCGVLAVALSGDPDKRYQSAAEFHEALQRIATRMHLFSTRANNIRRDQVSGQETVLLNVSKGEETVVDPGADAGHYGPTQVHRGQNAPYVNQAQRSLGGTVYDRNVVPGAANPGSQAGMYQGKSSVNQAGNYQGNPPGNPPGNYPGNPPGSHLNGRDTGSGANNQSSKKLVPVLAGVLALLVIILSAALIPRMAKGEGRMEEAVTAVFLNRRLWLLRIPRARRRKNLPDPSKKTRALPWRVKNPAAQAGKQTLWAMQLRMRLFRLITVWRIRILFSIMMKKAARKRKPKPVMKAKQKPVKNTLSLITIQTEECGS